MRIFAPIAILVACAPAPTPAPAPEQPTPASKHPTPTVPEPLAGLIAPWHPFDPAVAEASTTWLITRYTPGTYPCRPGPDGSLDMLLQDRFRVLQVPRGEVQAPAVDLDLYGLRERPGAPRTYAAGRRYLLLLRPGPKGQQLLADPTEFLGTDARLGSDEVLAILDLDESRAEAEAEAIQASQTTASWAPSRWAAARGAPRPDPDLQRELAAVLQSTILQPSTPLAQVRSWLGPPDAQDLGPGQVRRDAYILARPAYATPAQGAIYGSLRLTYNAQLELGAAELTYLRWHVRPREQASVALTPDEHAAHKLPHFTLDFR